jgi:hypothetical protein
MRPAPTFAEFIAEGVPLRGVRTLPASLASRAPGVIQRPRPLSPPGLIRAH